jgi:hypothetical protein
MRQGALCEQLSSAAVTPHSQKRDGGFFDGLALRRVGFDFTSLPANVILQHAARMIESIVDRGVHVLMPGLIVGATRHHEIRSGDVQLHAHAIVSAMLSMMGRPLDRHATMRDAFGKSRKLGGAPSNVLVDCGGDIDASERDLDRDHH